MPTTAKPPAPATKYDAEVADQLARAAGRIRAQDVLSGALVLAAVGLGYLAVVVVLDRWLDLPAWVRQLGFLGLLVVLGVVGYRRLVRPLRRTVNPLYAAKQVEETIPDAKNSVVNWVDLRDDPLPESIRAAVATKAARQMRDADLDHAGESKRLLWLGAAVAGLVVTLAVLFLVFRPAVFSSLVGRALNPFSSGVVATRTQITITEPAAGDLTVTAGQPVTVAVHVEGRVPDANGPDRLRVLLRHNPADPNFEEVPLEPAGSGRDWHVRVPEYLVQNGFWYRVAGGDGETAEHRVTVRPRPVFTEFEVRYEYPAYLRMKPEASKEPHLEAYRGTVVTVSAKANRELKDGRAVVNGQTVPGEVAGEGRDSLRVRLTLTDAGSYRLFFTSTTGETNTDSPPYEIRIISDQPPTITLLSPKEEEITLPANGLLKVDAAVGDDFGIDTVALRLKLADGRVLQPKPYQGGKSFRREADGTFPYSLDYKDSVPLAGLMDEAGQPVALKEGLALEYWLEAADNCTVPQANVGKSKVQRVKVAPPPADPPHQQQQKQDAEKRQQQEAAHQKAQQQKMEKEDRPAKQPPQEKAANPQPEASKPQSDPEKGSEQKAGEPMPNPAEKGGTETKPDAGKPGEPMPGAQPDQPPMPMGGTERPKEPPPADAARPDQEQVRREAQEIQRKLDQQERQAGEARGNDQPPPDQQAGAGERKGHPEPTAKPSEAKADGQPMGDKPDAAQPRGEGGKPQPAPQAEAKPDPKAKPDGESPADPQMKQPPLGGAAGTDKDAPQPKDGSPEPAGAPKPQEGGPKKPGEAKADGQPKPAAERGGPPDADAPKEERGGDARGEKPTPAGASKKPPAGEPMGGDKKPAGGPQDAAADKPTGGRPDSASAKDVPPGADPARAEQMRKELEQAAKDLASGDEKKQQAARDKLDQMMGKENRQRAEKEAQQLAKDLQSADPATRKAAEQKLNDMMAKAEQQANAGSGQPDPKQAEQMRKEMQQAARDLASDDLAKQEQARQKLDQMMGKENREKAEQLAKDLQSNDRKAREAAEQKLDDLRKQAEQAAGANGRKPDPQQAERMRKELEQAAKDLASGDERKQKAARDKLDQMIGKENRERAEKEAGQLAKDLQSKDPETQKAAQQKLDDLRKQAEQTAQKGGAKPDPKQAEQIAKELQQAAKDLASGEPQKQQAARDKLDKMVGEEARQKAEQLANDLQSPDPDKRKAAQQQLDELRKQAEQTAQQGNRQPPSPEDIAKLAKLAEDLNAKDDATRQRAVQELDRQLGKEAREQLQKDMKELAENPYGPRAQEIRKQMQDMAEKMKADGGGAAPQAGGNFRGGPARTDDTGRPLEDNPEFQKRAAEAHLRTFKDLAADEKKIKELGYTKDEYDRFLKGYEEYVRDLAQRADEAAAKPTQPEKPAAPVPPRRVDASRKVEPRKDAGGGPAAAGPSFAPPGYGDAQKRFTQGAAKVKPDEKK